jgi:hypothetical protein
MIHNGITDTESQYDITPVLLSAVLFMDFIHIGSG